MSVHHDSAAWRAASIVPPTADPAQTDRHPSARTFLAAIVALSVGLIVFSIAVRAPIDPGALPILGP